MPKLERICRAWYSWIFIACEGYQSPRVAQPAGKLPGPMPDHPPIVILGYPEAVSYLTGAHGRQVKAHVTIYGSREYPVDEPPVDRRLTLQFDDLCEPDPNDQ